MEQVSPIDEQPTCHKCGHILKAQSKYCNNCGSKHKSVLAKDREVNQHYQSQLKQFTSYSFLVLFLLAITHVSNDSFAWTIFWTILYACIDFGFSLYNGATFSLILPKRLELKPLVISVAFTALSGFTIYHLISELNLILYGEDYSLLYSFEDTAYPLLVTLISVAVFPAVFEELAFRGFLFNNLSVLSGRKAAIYGTAFIFTIAHFSIISFFWLFPFGLFLGYLRYRYNTLLYGMIGHFIHNSLNVLIEYSYLE